MTKMNIQQAKIKKLQAEIDLKKCILKELEEELEKSISEAIKDGPISAEEIVGNIIREIGFPGITGGFAVTHFDLKKFVKAGEQNHSKRTQPLIDTAKKVRKILNSIDVPNAVMVTERLRQCDRELKEALKTLEENEV